MRNVCFFQLPPVWSIWEKNIQVIPTVWNLLFSGKNWKSESWRPCVSDVRVTDLLGWHGERSVLLLELSVSKPMLNFPVLILLCCFNSWENVLYLGLWNWKMPSISSPLSNCVLPPSFLHPSFPSNYKMLMKEPWQRQVYVPSSLRNIFKE